MASQLMHTQNDVSDQTHREVDGGLLRCVLRGDARGSEGGDGRERYGSHCEFVAKSLDGG